MADIVPFDDIIGLPHFCHHWNFNTYNIYLQLNMLAIIEDYNIDFCKKYNILSEQAMLGQSGHIPATYLSTAALSGFRLVMCTGI